MEQRECSKCKCLKDISEFYPSIKYLCKSCHRASCLHRKNIEIGEDSKLFELCKKLVKEHKRKSRIGIECAVEDIVRYVDMKNVEALKNVAGGEV